MKLRSMADRPPRLEQVFQSYDSLLWFVTFNTNQRRKLLANDAVHSAFTKFSETGEQHGIGVGRYVLMPDHAHLFVRGGPDFILTQWVRMLKRTMSKALPTAAPHWQPGFFDHLLRHRESYAVKWEYVRQNPVRAGLVKHPEEWPYGGEITWLEAR